jgi:two-component sensor histidine kinase
MPMNFEPPSPIKLNQRLNIIAEAAALIACATTSSELCEVIRKTARYVGADAFFSFVLDDDGEELRVDLREGISDEALSAIASVRVQDPDGSTADLSRFGIRACCRYPLVAGEKRLGDLWFASRSRDAFSADEAAFLRTISHLAASTMERARHAKEIERLNVQVRYAARETFYRVRSNIDLLYAMVSLAELKRAEVEPGKEFKWLGRKVQIMAAVHEATSLYTVREEDVSTVSAGDVFERLIGIFREWVAPRPITTSVDDARLTARAITALSLCTSELVYNAFKHGLGLIHVGFTVQGGSAMLEVTDEGVGFPHAMDPTAAETFGLELVNHIAKWDLQGDIRFENRPEGGAWIILTFPLPTCRPGDNEG